jgi:YggT family protein
MHTVFLVLMYLISIYEFLIFIRVLLSWFPMDPYNPIIRALYRVTEPVLAPARRLIPPFRGTLDISPIVVLFALEILRWILRAIGS